MAGSGRANWQFRSDIEGLRALAILGVVLFHAGARGVPGGFLGVDVFFVLSGFLITGVLVAEVYSTGRVFLPAFWARRIRRLLPAATLVSLVTLGLSARFESPFAQQIHSKSAIAFATYWSNLLFIRRGTNYFDQSVATDPFLHTWSLAIEEQFYLLFAPLCLLLALWARRRTSEEFRGRFLRCTIGVFILSFAVSLVLTAQRPQLSFYGLPSRGWEFAAGGLLALLPRQTRVRAWRTNSALAAAGLLMIVGSLLALDESTPNPGWFTLLPVLGTAALIYAGQEERTAIGRFLETGLMRWMGRLSYSWYLWHWPIAVYWKDLVGDRIPLLFGMPLVSLALAQLTYVVIEAPARKATWLQPPRRSLLAALGMAIVTVGAGLLLLRPANRRVDDPEFASILQARETRNRLTLTGCLLSEEEIAPKDCRFGDTSSTRVMVLFGDSHAAQWFDALHLSAQRLGLMLLPMTKSGCPSVALTVRLPAPSRIYAECDRWRELVVRRLRELQPLVVVLTNHPWYTGRLEGTGDKWSSPPTPAALWRKGLESTLARLPATTAVVLIEDSPRPGFDVPECLFKHVREPEQCAFLKESAFAPGMRALDSSLEVADARVTSLDFTDEICPGPVCPVVFEDLIMFSDRNHLSVPYTLRLSPRVERALGKVPAINRQPSQNLSHPGGAAPRN